MEQKYGFTKMTVAEFETWLANLRVARTILKIQQHHTYIPSYAHFNESNHFERQLAMKNSHLNNGWSDIGQHFTIFPDGAVMTGRSLEMTPACIYNQNANSICIENLGFFDIGKDVMRQSQKDAIISVTAALCKRFNIPVTTNGIVYHHWFDLNTGARNNGTKNNKSCPGTNFFGGNKVADCEANFLPLVSAKLNGMIKTDDSAVLKYVVVDTDFLNVRMSASASSAKATGREPALFGAVLRVYEVKNGWFKISNSKPHWVSGRYTQDVKFATVSADALNVRTGPGVDFPKTASLKKGEEVFVVSEENGWCKIAMEEKWVKKSYLKLKE
ncbi:N-acetylmuramoyl-L-alanine amidase [Flavobacterium sp. MAH-1]|uniref:N-acetylmuramoyl-L-alanine amidase n=1 Tax=Flavobacterium agri TaxID=2743471 RepID=A0A7Y8Y243_9FLAO|nr:SH3 domain-containing protein [Flavobacterium agri]NUY81129.1 N-acetylmuramoyl-L-alanine amidase [Flavobacterium agri]NYA71153.1 N-acetylmuramoyl-L-alanine amidase [Flavobacterium agri]